MFSEGGPPLSAFLLRDIFQFYSKLFGSTFFNDAPHIFYFISPTVGARVPFVFFFITIISAGSEGGVQVGIVAPGSLAGVKVRFAPLFFRFEFFFFAYQVSQIVDAQNKMFIKLKSGAYDN